MSDLADRAEPSAARLFELHARVIDGDRTALEQLAGELWLPLCRRLRRSFRRAAPDLVADAVTDAILTYAAQLQTFDTSRQVPIDHFIWGISARILRDRPRSNGRREVRENDYAEHLLRSHEHRTDDGAVTRAAVQQVRSALQLVCNAAELAAMVAWLDDDDTNVVAVHLGLSNLAPLEQRREVRRFTDRVIKRLQRLFRGGKRPIQFDTKK